MRRALYAIISFLLLTCAVWSAGLNFDPNKPLGTDKLSTIDDYLRETRIGVYLFGTREHDTQGLHKIPSLTQTEIDNLSSANKPNGRLVYNSTTGTIQYWTGATWVGFGSSPILLYASVSNYANFTAAITAIGSATTNLLVDQSSHLSSDTVVPSNIHLMFVNGGLVVPGNFDLTINGPIKAGPYQIFSCAGSGKVEGFQQVPTIYAEWWGVDGSADEVQINQALTARSKYGGIVKLLSKQYNIAATSITVPDGCRLLGNADAFGGVVTTGAIGTKILNAANVPAIIIPGSYGFEVAYLHIYGTESGTDDGIYLTEDVAHSCPRSGTIHDNSIYKIGRDGIRVNACGGYVRIFHNSILYCGGCGINVVDDTGALKEFLYIDKSTMQACDVAGLKITAGIYIYGSNLDITDNADGLYISGARFDLYFDTINFIRNTNNGIKIHADADITRLHFRKIEIGMLGASADERAILGDHTGSYTCVNLDIDGLFIYRIGATTPTKSIDLSSLFFNSQILKVNDASGAQASLAANGAGTPGIKFEFNDVTQTILTPNDPTPSVLGRTLFVTANTVSTTYTDFPGGYPGQRITILIGDANCNFDCTGTKLWLDGTGDWNSVPQFSRLEAVMDVNGNWWCTKHPW